MLSAFFDDDGEHQSDLIEIGDVEPGDIYSDKCCNGFDWEVQYINQAVEQANNSIWGTCLNPKCAEGADSEGGGYYQGVSYILHIDLVEMILLGDK